MSNKKAFLALVWAAIATTASAQSPSYVRRGDEVERRYQQHRADLQQFHDRFSLRLDTIAPELKAKLLPPADVPFGYQILPTILPDPAPSKQGRIRLSPFSWNRTDSVIARESDSLSLLKTRVEKADTLSIEARRREYSSIADAYRTLVNGQKFIADLIQYNRLWQNEIARFPKAYADARRLQDVAMERQRIVDSLAGGTPTASVHARIDSLTRSLDSAIKKAPAPSYVRVEHPADHQWLISVPVYTDITDSAYVDMVRSSIEDGWHLRDSLDEFTLKLDVRRIPPAQLYPNGDIPAKGTHIDVGKHIDRFPPNAAVLTTGSNTTYVLGRAILLGPHTLRKKTLVHEFGHMLGFKDGYFRSYRDQSDDSGYQVLEVILDPDAIVATPEGGHARAEHMKQLISESQRKP